MPRMGGGGACDYPPSQPSTLTCTFSCPFSIALLIFFQLASKSFFVGGVWVKGEKKEKKRKMEKEGKGEKG